MQGLLYEESGGSVGISVVSKRKTEHRKRARKPEDADVAKRGGMNKEKKKQVNTMSRRVCRRRDLSAGDATGQGTYQ